MRAIKHEPPSLDPTSVIGKKLAKATSGWNDGN